jgi:secreted trypsin-like serine protease
MDPRRFRVCASVVLLGAGIAATAHAQQPPRPQPAKLVPTHLASEQRIIGGKLAQRGQIPWQVSMQIYADDAVYLCGGSVIAPGWVLTAAHCVEKEDAQATHPALVDAADIDVRSASLRVDRGGLAAQAEKIFTMPARNAQTSAFDVALLKVATHSAAVPIALQAPVAPPGKDPLANGSPLQVSGFGVTDSGDTSPVLMFANVAYVPRTICNSTQSYAGKIKPSMVCAGKVSNAQPTDSCQGDSGGPLFQPASGNVPATLVGVVSWGEGCATPDFPGVYAKVAHPDIARWVQETMAAN